MSADGVLATTLASAIAEAKPRLVGSDVSVHDLHHDSRDVTPGTGFVAIRGARVDGHAVSANHLKHGFCENLEIQPERPVLDVPRVHSQSLVPCRQISPVYPAFPSVSGE